MMMFIRDKRSHQEILEISGKYSKNRFSLSILNSIDEIPKLRHKAARAQSHKAEKPFFFIPLSLCSFAPLSLSFSVPMSLCSFVPALCP
jgi:hypothetical protein